MTAFLQSNGATTRQAPATHQEWVPLPYMERAVQFLCSRPAAVLPLKPGGRKTSITLEAFRRLREQGKARTMLVVAPLRVCRQTWRQEGRKWSQFRDISFALLHGRDKNKALESGAEVYLINPEGLAWLCKKFFGRPLPFDIVTIDELTKFKNAQAKRHKELRPRLRGVKYRWGLTGSFFSKGHMDLFGQMLILDDGAALGRYITHYRDQYFQVGFDGFTYTLLPGAEARILERLAPYVFPVEESDYAQLPGIVNVPRPAKMEPRQFGLYQQMKREMIISLPEGRLTAANAGACYSKLSQMANGAVYMEDRSVTLLHDLKLDMLEELIEELNGEPLLIGYEFNHDLSRIRECLGADLPYLGKGTTATQEDEWVAAWNRNELPVMAMHPQSGGHGLNIQEGQARHVCWFSVTWDWELYDQFIRRVRRSGNHNEQVFNHLLIIEGTIDEQKLAAVGDREFTERRLETALRRELLRESQRETNLKETTMTEKLSQPANAGWGAPPAQQQAPEQAPLAQQANTAATWGAQPPTDADQRARIQEQIAPQPDRAAGAMAAFSGDVQGQAVGIAGTDYGPVATGGPQQQAPEQAPPANAGWGAPPQAEQQQTQEPAAQPANAGWGAPPAQQAPQTTQAPPPVESQPHPAGPAPDRPVQGGWGDAPFEPDAAKKPAKELSANTGDERKSKKPTKAEIEAERQERIALYNARATVLAAVLPLINETNASVEEARALMAFVERG